MCKAGPPRRHVTPHTVLVLLRHTAFYRGLFTTLTQEMGGRGQSIHPCSSPLIHLIRGVRFERLVPWCAHPHHSHPRQRSTWMQKGLPQVKLRLPNVRSSSWFLIAIEAPSPGFLAPSGWKGTMRPPKCKGAWVMQRDHGTFIKARG